MLQLKTERQVKIVLKVVAKCLESCGIDIKADRMNSTSKITKVAAYQSKSVSKLHKLWHIKMDRSESIQKYMWHIK